MLAALLPLANGVETVLPAIRQLQLIQPKHRQRQQHEYKRKEDQHRRRLQSRLQIKLGAKQTYHRTHNRIGGSHAQHIGQGKG